MDMDLHDFGLDYNEGIIESSDEEECNDGEIDGAGNDGQSVPSKPISVALKKSAVRRSRNVLTEETLCGPRGIVALRSYFKGFKFRGRGHELDDLTRMLKRYELWAHRLCPQLHFDDCIDRISKLGEKKSVQMYMNKYRMKQLHKELAEADALHADLRVDDGNQLNQPLDPLDSMLDEQIALSRGRSSYANTSGIGNLDNSAFDAVRNESTHQAPGSSKSLVDDADNSSAKSPPLNEEQRAKIAANRLKAMELRKARLLAQSQNVE
ncbi:protein TIPIN homolog [Anopheles nili]|uniref:protein TIPIN homolog n=1 Tax=Anopheles nili TaxID=185578 RepID=UPI00237BBF54|nr:protein TIPIN homolog [Anopheles nili]